MSDLVEQQRDAAHNQALFREVNERVEEVSRGNFRGEFICECADESCSQQFVMMLDDYEAMRSHPARFAVMPDEAHVVHEAEVIVEKTDQYWVVEKIGAAEPVAIALDPREQGWH